MKIKKYDQPFLFYSKPIYATGNEYTYIPCKQTQRQSFLEICGFASCLFVVRILRSWNIRGVHILYRWNTKLYGLNFVKMHVQCRCINNVHENCKYVSNSLHSCYYSLLLLLHVIAIATSTAIYIIVT